MQAFSHARDVVVNSSQFIHYQTGEGSGIKALFEGSLPSAIHDSAAQEAAVESLPKTKHGELADELVSWAHQPNTSISTVWVIGPKSNLAHLCADRLDDHLAASFFFPTNGELEGDDPYSRCFFTTIAYQLATSFPAYRNILEAKLCHDPGLVHKSLKVQFRELIARPFQELLARGETIGSRRYIIVEGLDECKSAQVRSVILRILTTKSSSRTLPFRWVVFSRSSAVVDAQISGLGRTAFPLTGAHPLHGTRAWRRFGRRSRCNFDTAQRKDLFSV